MRYWITSALLAAAAVAACSRPADDGARLGDVVSVVAPAGDGSRYPRLSGGGEEPLTMSWLQSGPGGESLQFATWQETDWSGARTVAGGDDWFVNWADFPSVVASRDGHHIAHWLHKRPGHTYSYDVQISTLAAPGGPWTAPLTPHDDGTPTEHGFVSLVRDRDAWLAIWLDGRHTGAPEAQAEHDGHGEGAMTLRSARIDDSGQITGAAVELDARVCDCCQTDAAMTTGGPVVAYRDRSDDETRDIAVVRRVDDRWLAPSHVNPDGWVIDACPVNGPAIDADGDAVAVAWFTAPDLPRIRLAFSIDGGRRFDAPIDVASGRVTGRVDVVLIDESRAVVSWLDTAPPAARLLAQVFDRREGAVGPPLVVATTNIGSGSGFPQLARSGLRVCGRVPRSDDPPPGPVC